MNKRWEIAETRHGSQISGSREVTMLPWIVRTCGSGLSDRAVPDLISSAYENKTTISKSNVAPVYNSTLATVQRPGKGFARWDGSVATSQSRQVLCGGSSLYHSRWKNILKNSVSSQLALFGKQKCPNWTICCWLLPSVKNYTSGWCISEWTRYVI